MINIYVRGKEVWIEDGNGCTGIDFNAGYNWIAMQNATALKKFIEKIQPNAEVQITAVLEN